MGDLDLGIDLAERHLIQQLRELHNQLDVIRGGRTLDNLYEKVGDGDGDGHGGGDGDGGGGDDDGDGDGDGDGAEDTTTGSNENKKIVDTSVLENFKDETVLNGSVYPTGKTAPDAHDVADNRVDGDTEKMVKSIRQSPEMSVESSF